jgi:hypothetical protein
MKCEDFERAIHEVEFRGAPPPEGYAEHSRHCETCSAQAVSQRDVSAALAEYSAALGDGAGLGTEARVREAFLKRRRRAGRSGWIWTAAAATLLLVTVSMVGVRLRHRTEPERNRRVFYALPGMPLDRDPEARVMRIRVPRSDLRRWGMAVSGTGDLVEAEVLVGNDGLPRGVRVGPTME